MINILIQVLLALLPKILDFLLDWFAQGRKLTPAQAEQLNYAIYQFRQIEDTAVKMGATAGGTKPPVNSLVPIWQD